MSGNTPYRGYDKRNAFFLVVLAPLGIYKRIIHYEHICYVKIPIVIRSECIVLIKRYVVMQIILPLTNSICFL